MKVDLVLEGGGVKNIALLGAVTVLAEAGYTFPRVAGTSGGAIIAAGIAAYQKAGRDLSGMLDDPCASTTLGFSSGGGRAASLGRSRARSTCCAGAACIRATTSTISSARPSRTSA